MKDRIHILGASGSGASTLGKELSLILPHVNFDGDDYFWAEKFSKQRAPKDRVNLLKEDIKNYKKWILSGAVCGWGDEFKSYFDLVIFVYTPEEIRLKRLQERELQRYGDEILPGGSRYEQSKIYLEWASLYDKGGLEVRSKTLHEYWMSSLSCPILRIEGDQSIQERVNIVLDYLKVNRFINRQKYL
ncbi:AAA family ATPase [Clostridium sp. D2Q-11]|uniref:AAA family ATPase n=1 Tax=Anaeromonas frigoriresistens TaxID=2683708 RepID=A0A942UR84_9FIRM|nr:AAA family ATPase [Anaeromonas frigoriresistens]MBS4537723.1 AAA family ATPase [Anaeromonas frigoriresistens]